MCYIKFIYGCSLVVSIHTNVGKLLNAAKTSEYMLPDMAFKTFFHGEYNVEHMLGCIEFIALLYRNAVWHINPLRGRWYPTVSKK